MSHKKAIVNTGVAEVRCSRARVDDKQDIQKEFEDFINGTRLLDLHQLTVAARDARLSWHHLH